MIQIEDVMTRNPSTLSRFSSLADARQLMSENKFRHVPVVDDGELLGVVSQRNVLAHGNADALAVGKEELLENEKGILLADIMTSDLITIGPKTSIRSAAQLILKHKVGCLPVINNEGKMAGIVTDTDFVAITTQLLEIMEETDPVSYDELLADADY